VSGENKRVRNRKGLFCTLAPRNRFLTGMALGYPLSRLLQWDIQGHPQFPLTTGQTNPSLVRLTIMTLAWSTSDRAKSSRDDVEHLDMARRNRAEVVVADEVGVYHCVQRVVRGAFLSGLTHHNSETGSYGKFHILSKLRLLPLSFATFR